MEYPMSFPLQRTPQQNGVVERKNRTLQKMAPTMFHESNVAIFFGPKFVNTACYMQNMISLRPMLGKTHYELWKGIKPRIS